MIATFAGKLVPCGTAAVAIDPVIITKIAMLIQAPIKAVTTTVCLIIVDMFKRLSVQIKSSYQLSELVNLD